MDSIPSHLYRFRSAKNLLEREELKNQEIYFAHPEELNDPMEGFRDVCWHGDEIVWRNLLRHYVLCLEWAFSLLCIFGETQKIEWDHIAVFNAGEANFTPQQQELRESILREFFLDPGIARWIASIAIRDAPVRRSELILHLRGLHFFAMSIIRRHYEARGLLPQQDIPADLQEKLQDAPNLAAKTVEAIHSVKLDSQDREYAFDELFGAQRRLMSELDLIVLYNNAANPKGQNWRFVFVGFCDEYVQRLETLVYPEWFTACFMQECHNSAVWGTYGDNHAAVCMKFKVHNKGEHPIIRLNRINGYGGGGPTYMDVEHEFLKVVYENEHLPVDFFRSLGRLTIPVLKKYWYSDKSGQESVCADDNV
jgi:hypothetical protein